MKKLSLIAMKSDADSLMDKLMELSCVEVEATVPEDLGEAALEHADYDVERTDYERDAQKLEAAIKFLGRYRSEKKGLFYKRKLLFRERLTGRDDDYMRAAALAEKTAALIAENTAVSNELQKQKQLADSLIPWMTSDLELGFEGTASSRILRGVLPVDTDVEALAAALYGKAYEIVSRDENGIYICVICHLRDEDDTRYALSKLGFTRLDFKEIPDAGTAGECSLRISDEMMRLTTLLSKNEEKAADYAKDIDLLESAYDIAKTRSAAASAKQRMLCTDATVYLNGWVPLEACKAVSEELEKLGCYYEYSDPEEGDTPPSLLRGNGITEPFESVVGLYSMPAYKTFDPTVIMAFFYFMIFGLMLGDVVYGILLAVGGFLAVKYLDLSDGIKRLVKLFAICGISCTVVGILFGSYLGDLPKVFVENMLGLEFKGNLALGFDPLENSILFLVVSLAVGAVHLLAAMGIKFYILCKDGKPLDAIFDIGSWYLLFAGIAVLCIKPDIGMYIAIAGVLMLILTQGRAEKNIFMKLFKGIASLYDIVSYLSDLLSYSRIMALGLASAVIASVVNLLSTLMGPGVVGYILMVVILVVGHGINLAINLLGTFVHTSRLQYIEFFGKFYEDGGRPFLPVRPDIKYTRVSDKKEN